MSTETLRKTLIAVAVATVLGISASAVAETPEAARLEAHSDGVAAAISDTLITAKVKSELAGDRQLKHSEIDVTTTDGAVTLSGYATDSDARATAGMIARSVEGVRTVRDELKVPAGATVAATDANRAMRSAERVASDTWITTKVKSEIAADSLTKGFEVGVTTRHGAVVLDGTLSSADAIQHVKEIAEKVKDVKSVDTTALRISST